MATPKRVKRIDKEKALKIMNKHYLNGTGYYEYGDCGDFIYKERGRLYLIRSTFGQEYETGEVAQ